MVKHNSTCFLNEKFVISVFVLSDINLYKLYGSLVKIINPYWTILSELLSVCVQRISLAGQPSFAMCDISTHVYNCGRRNSKKEDLAQPALDRVSQNVNIDIIMVHLAHGNW